MPESLPPRRKLYNQYKVMYIFIHLLFRKLVILTKLSLIDLFITLLETTLLSSILILIFSLSVLLLLLTTLFLLLLLLLILYS